MRRCTRGEPACPTLCLICSVALRSKPRAEQLARAPLARRRFTRNLAPRRSNHGALAEGGADRRALARSADRLSGDSRADAAPPRSARAAQADIQMMLAAQCHLGTKCVPRPCKLQTLSLGFMRRRGGRKRCVPVSQRRCASLPVVCGVLNAACAGHRNCDFQMERYVWRRRADGAAQRVVARCAARAPEGRALACCRHLHHEPRQDVG